MHTLKVAALLALLAAVAACATSTPAPPEPLITSAAPAEARPAAPQPDASPDAPPDAQQPEAVFEDADAQGDGAPLEVLVSAPKHDPNDPLSPPPDVAAAPKDALKTVVKHEGAKHTVSSKVIKPGTGAAKPADADIVEVHYTGWTTDGKMFDSSIKRGEPIVFPLKHVIPGWREAVKLMVVGERRRVWIPEELAYKGVPGAPQGMLVFDIELIAIMDVPVMPEPPEDDDHDR